MIKLFSQSKSSLFRFVIPLFIPSIFVNASQALASEGMNSNRINEDKINCLSSSFCEQLADRTMFEENINQINGYENVLASSQLQLLEDSLNFIEQIDDLEIKADTLINLAWQYYRLGELDRTIEVLNEALEIGQDIEDASSKTLMMIKVADVFIEIEDFETASEVLDLALESSQDIEENSVKATLLLDLASKYDEIENLEQKEIVLTQVDTIVAEIENPPPTFPFEPTPFKGQIFLGSNVFFAEDSLINFNIGANFSKRRERDELDLFFRYLNSFDSSRDSGDENRILLDVVTQYRYYLKERKYLFANLGYLQDDFSGNDARFSYFTGLGFNVWRGENEDQTFDMQLGIGDLVQNSDISNKDADFPVFQYALLYRNVFFNDWKFVQTFKAEVPVSNTANYFLDSRSTLKIPAINNWSVFSTLNFRYFGIPEVDEPNLSATFTAGLKYDF